MAIFQVIELRTNLLCLHIVVFKTVESPKIFLPFRILAWATVADNVKLLEGLIVSFFLVNGLLNV